MSEDLERADSLISTRMGKSAASSDGRRAGHSSEHSPPFTPPWAASDAMQRLSEAGKRSEDGRTSDTGTIATASDAAYATGDASRQTSPFASVQWRRVTLSRSVCCALSRADACRWHRDCYRGGAQQAQLSGQLARGLGRCHRCTRTASTCQQHVTHSA